MKLTKIDEGILCGSSTPAPGDKSSYMPWFCDLKNGELLASTVIGSYFDAPDAKTHVLKSTDGGKTFVDEGSPFDFGDESYPVDGLMKITALDSDHILAVGYGFVHNHGTAGPPNVETGGCLDCPAFFAQSFDGGTTFTRCQRLPSAWGTHTEASAPMTVLPNGDWVTPTSAMPDWDGKFVAPLCGRLLRSCDKGATWNDDTVTMDFGPETTVWEQRIAVTESGRIVDIAWKENLKTGELYNNHVVISKDNGKTFSAPIDTGIRGQASSVCAIGGERVLALHSMRRHVERPGVLACVVNLENDTWDIEYSQYVWEPNFVMTKKTDNLEVFSSLRFGQPSATLLQDGTLLYTQWLMENEVCRTIWQRFRVRLPLD